MLTRQDLTCNVLSKTTQTAIDSAITVATGKKLQGTGVWSWIKVDGTPVTRAAIGVAFLSILGVALSPDLVSAIMSDSSVNS